MGVRSSTPRPGSGKSCEAQILSESRVIALTWFVASYFIGAFGFPSVGGWVLVHIGKGALLTLIVACGLTALALTVLRDRRRLETLSAKG